MELIREPRQNAVCIQYFKDEQDRLISHLWIECKDLDMQTTLEKKAREIHQLLLGEASCE